METDKKNNADTSVDSIIKLSQATIFFSLLLFLVQYKWLEYFYSAIGAGWVVSHFTWNQILFTATPYGGIFLLAVFIFAIFPGRMTTTIRFTALAICHFLTFLVALYKADGISLILLVSVWLFSGLFLLLGGLVVNTLFFKPENGGSRISPLVVVFVFGIIYVSNMRVADMVSIYRLDNSDEYYPQLTEEGIFGRTDTPKLIAPIGDKFLLLNETPKGKQFRLVEDISKYRIHSIKRPFFLDNSILSI